MRTVFKASYVVNCTAEYGMICQEPESGIDHVVPRPTEAHPRAVDPVPSHEPGIPFLLVHPYPTRPPSVNERPRLERERTQTHKEAQTPPYAFPPLALSLPVVVSRGWTCLRGNGVSPSVDVQVKRRDLQDDFKSFEGTDDGPTCCACHSTCNAERGISGNVALTSGDGLTG